MKHVFLCMLHLTMISQLNWLYNVEVEDGCE